MEIKFSFNRQLQKGRSVKMSDTNLKQKESLGRNAHRLNIVLAIAVSFICYLAIPFSFNESVGKVVGIVTVAICSIFTVRVSSRKIMTILLLLVLFATLGLGGGLPFVTFILASTVGCGTFAWLIAKTDSPLLAIIPALAYSISTVVTKSWFASLMTLFFIFPAVLLAQTYEKLSTRVGSLLRISLGYLSFIILGIVFSLLYFTGEFRVEIIGDILDTARESLAKILSSMEVSLVNGNTEMLMSETDAYNYVSQLISLLPALTVVLCFVLAYFAQKIQFSIFKYTDGEQEFNELRRIVIMSPISAVVFILSFLIYTVTDPTSAVSTVCANLYYIFMPGLAFMGIKSFTEGRTGLARGGCSTSIITVLFIFLLFFNIGIALVMAACFGSFAAIEGPIRKYLSKKNG